jgi:hypothetical protein
MAAPDRMLSANFSAADLLQASKTWEETRVQNEPLKPETWKALEQLCEEILEPVQAQFGRPAITYGFASQTLIPKIRALASARNVHSHISPNVDQHAGCERKANGDPVCSRLGQAVDFCVPGVSSAVLACWVAENLPFDRMYFYGVDRPIHVSVGPDNCRSVTEMLPGKTGTRMPKPIKKERFVERYRGG